MNKIEQIKDPQLREVFRQNDEFIAKRHAKHEFWKGPRLPDPNPYYRTPQQVAAAMAETKRRVPDPDLPENDSPPTAPKYVVERNEQTARLTKAAEKPTTAFRQEELPFPFQLAAE